MTRIQTSPGANNCFEGQHYRGRGDVEYLQLLDTARRMFAPDPEFQNMAMLYTPAWNGLVEGATWDAWWVQNSYGTTYCALPFYQEPFVTFLQNSQDLWFDQMGDGQRVGAVPPFDWIAPDGCLCDAAKPGWIVYKQGDGQTNIHDWGVEFTAAGLLLQCELLLIGRDQPAIARYLPRLERCADFIETRRDSKNNLFLAGPAGNLLAPSYAGWKRPDGTYDRAYLTGLSVTTIAALDRLIELEKLAGRPAEAARYEQRRTLAKQGLSLLTTDEGYLIRSLDPDGVKHGVYGAKQHGYFEASPNHDAICFRVVDDAQSRRIYDKLAAIPGLRPHDFILPNYPSYDDMYEPAAGLWEFGTWVNGGHWSTCEARLVMAYYRLGKYEDARKSMQRLLTFARRFRMDNPLTQCGAEVYQPKQPVNLCYDTFGPAAALMRGLFEYLYAADDLTLIPHVPPGITELEQRDPIRFGKKQIYLATLGTGLITAVQINGKTWQWFTETAVTLPYDQTPDEARVVIAFGGAQFPSVTANLPNDSGVSISIDGKAESKESLRLKEQALQLFKFLDRLQGDLAASYASAHARLAFAAIATVLARWTMQAQGQLAKLPEPTQLAADQAYLDAAAKLYAGLETVVKTYKKSADPQQRKIYKAWRATTGWW